MSRKHRHGRRFPEAENSHSAGEIERARAQMRLLLFSLAVASKPTENKRTMSKRKTVQKQKQTKRRPLDVNVRSSIIEKDKQHGRQWLLDELRKLHVSRGETVDGYNDTDAIKRVIEEPQHCFTDAWVTRLEILAGVKSNTTYTSPPIAEPVVVEMPVVETGIIQSAKPIGIEFNGRTVRMVPGDEPVFVAKDLVEAVGAGWRGGAIDHIPAEYRGMRLIRTPSGEQEMSVLTEAGMNMYLFRSDKPAALPWQRHLAEDVLPSIRKTGRYEAPGSTVTAIQGGADSVLLQMIATQTQILGQLAQGQTALLGLLAAKPTNEQPVPEQPKAKPSKPVAPVINLNQQRIRFPRDRRALLNAMVDAQVPSGLTSDENRQRRRALWGMIYAEMALEGVFVREGVARYNLTSEEMVSIHPLEWIVMNGHLELAITSALKVFPPHERAM